MGEVSREQLHRIAGLAFVAVVTVCLLALAFASASGGLAAAPATVVYALAAGFGLECCGAVWAQAWRGQPSGALRG